MAGKTRARFFWVLNRTLNRLTVRAARSRRGPFSLVRHVGRRSGRERAVILGYYEDGPNLVTLAMNGWGAGEPAWWLNLRAQPNASVTLKDGARPVRARAAEGEERQRLWDGFRAYAGWGDDIDVYARLRSTETAVVVLEPRA